MIKYKTFLSLIEGKTSAAQRRRNERGYGYQDIKQKYDDRESLIVKTKREKKDEDEDDEDGQVSEEFNDDELDSIILEELNTQDRKEIARRFKLNAKTRLRKEEIALSHKADEKTIEERARKMAILLIKKKFAKKSLDSLSVVEKQRLEHLLKSKSELVKRLTNKLKQKILKLERERLNK